MKKLWIVAVTAAHLGALNADTDRPRTMDGNRFLFVVETSATSSRLEHGGRQALVDLIYTGIYGQMRTGDTFGLWAFNEQVFAGVYAMQTWDSENTMELASNAGQFLKAQRYHKKGKFEPVVQEVLRVIRGVKDVNVFIISDAETRPPTDAFGLAFDREYEENIGKLPNSKTPLITTIVGRNGSISNWFVSVAGEPIRLPAFAVPPHVAPPPAVAATVAKVQPARPKRSPIIMKRSSPTAESVTAETSGASPPKLGEVIASRAQIAFVSSVQTNAAPAVAPPRSNPEPSTNAKAAPTIVPNSDASAAVAVTTSLEKKSDAPSSTSVASQAAPQNLAAQTKPTETPALANQPRAVANIQPQSQVKPPTAPPPRVETPAVARATLPGPEPLKVAARERTETAPASSPQPQQVPAIAPKAFGVAAATPPSVTDRLFSPAAMVVIGGLLLILAAALAILFLQRLRRPAQASFITQSLEGQ